MTDTVTRAFEVRDNAINAETKAKKDAETLRADQDAAVANRVALEMVCRGLVPEDFEPRGKSDHDLLVAAVGDAVEDAAERSDDYLRATVDGLARERSAAGDFRTRTTPAAGSRQKPGAIGARAGLMRPPVGARHAAAAEGGVIRDVQHPESLPPPPAAGAGSAVSRDRTRPYAYDTGRLNVPTSGRKARPGDGVYWNATANRFQVPTTDAQELLVLGIVAYDVGTVQSTLGTTPTTENSDQFIQYDDDDVIKVAVLGTFYLIAGGAVEYGNILRHQNDDYKWDNDTPTSYAETVPPGRRVRLAFRRRRRHHRGTHRLREDPLMDIFGRDAHDYSLPPGASTTPAS